MKVLQKSSRDSSYTNFPLANETYEFINQMVLIERFEYFEAKSEDFLGRGTFSDVFRGRDSGNGKKVAIRRIPYSTIATRDLKLLPALDHPNLVPILTIQQKAIYLYMVTGYYQYDLKKFLFIRGPFRDEEIRNATNQLAAGYAHLYSKNIVHQNIKTTNIMVKARDKKRFTLKIADFGLRRFLEAYHSAGFVGSFMYMSPEVGAGAILKKPCPVNAKSDIFSLGIVLHECASGMLPMNEEQALTLFIAAANQDPEGSSKVPRLSSLLPSELSDLLHQMLEYENRCRINPIDLCRHPYLSAGRNGTTLDAPSEPWTPKPKHKNPFCILS